MKAETLEGLVEVLQKYLRFEHPNFEIGDELLGAKLVLLYLTLSKELLDVDAYLIRHNVSLPLEELDLVMEIEKIGLYSKYCVHLRQDKYMIASWTEERLRVD